MRMSCSAVTVTSPSKRSFHFMFRNGLTPSSIKFSNFNSGSTSSALIIEKETLTIDKSRGEFRINSLTFIFIMLSSSIGSMYSFLRISIIPSEFGIKVFSPSCYWLLMSSSLILISSSFFPEVRAIVLTRLKMSK